MQVQVAQERNKVYVDPIYLTTNISFLVQSKDAEWKQDLDFLPPGKSLCFPSYQQWINRNYFMHAQQNVKISVFKHNS